MDGNFEHVFTSITKELVAETISESGNEWDSNGVGSKRSPCTKLIKRRMRNDHVANFINNDGCIKIKLGFPRMVGAPKGRIVPVERSAYDKKKVLSTPITERCKIKIK